MRRTWKKEISKNIQFLIACFLAGTAAGALFENLAYPYRGQEIDVLNVYLADRLKERKIWDVSYFRYLLWYRLRFFFPFWTLGSTSAARFVVLFGMLAAGFFSGAACSMAILQYGIRGIIFFFAANLPQGLAYVPALFLLCAEMELRNGMVIRGSRELLKEYLMVSFLCLLIYLAGIFMEFYGNPGFFVWICKKY